MNTFMKQLLLLIIAAASVAGNLHATNVYRYEFTPWDQVSGYTPLAQG